MLTKEQLRKCYDLSLNNYFDLQQKWMKSFNKDDEGNVHETASTRTYKEFMDEAKELAYALKVELNKK